MVDPMMDSPARSRLRDSTWWQAYGRRRYAVLFYAMLMMLMLVPITGALGLGKMAIQWLYFLCLLAAIMPNANPKNHRWVFAFLMVLGVVIYATDFVGPRMSFDSALPVFAVMGLLAAAGAMRFVIRAKHVTGEVIYAALSTYLLVGLFFGLIYSVLEQSSPGSLTGPGELTPTASVYYSFVTLATLGYGDILPRSDLARGIATFEVVGGQLFLAVMIARLIGLFGAGDPID